MKEREKNAGLEDKEREEGEGDFFGREEGREDGVPKNITSKRA
jgi:hypothetical protein